jgi:peptidoglycan/xylan/chitin deacetylase (PgdA/CDA1 family)
MRVPGWKTARLAGRWMRSRFTGGALILGYHRVARTVHDPFDLCVSPCHFDEQIEVLRATATPTALADLVRGLGGRRLPRRPVAVTFDDGYADFTRHAEPTLHRHDIPATVFVASGSIGRWPWWDELSWLVRELAQRRATVLLDLAGPGKDFRSQTRLDFASPEKRRAAFAELYQRLFGFDVKRRQEVLDQLRAAAGVKGNASAGDQLLDEHDLARLGQSGLVSVGSHTVSHTPLAALPQPDQWHELGESRRRLEQITGRPVEDLAYPHGSVGSATRRLAREAGYRSACGSVQDVARPGADPYCLPRFWIPDWDGVRFARWLHRWGT